MSTYQKIRNLIYMISVMFFLLTPFFLKNSAHFDWGFGVLMLVVFPLFYLVPILLLIDLIRKIFGGKNPKIIPYLLLIIAASWVWALTNIFSDNYQ